MSSGEINVLQYVRDAHGNDKPLRIFDCGANKGQYAKQCLDFFGLDTIEIHCFEPGHTTYEILQKNIPSKNNVILNNFGLSDKDSEQKLYYNAAGSGLASIYKRQLDYFNIDFNQSEMISLTTIDNYIRNRFQDRDCQIDLLKIDVEGNELKVLQGAQDTLTTDKVKTIQLEFGGCNIDSHTFMRDFWNLLHNKYRMYRILRDGFFEIANYQETLENFSCQNLFFVYR